MAKSRRTKAKHQDFQKVKLKIGKKLPKGLNETKTAFKSKSIQIKEQLKQESSQATTRRKQSLSDLLSHLRHHNTSVRLDGVSGLRELVSNYPDIIPVNLANLVEKVAPLYLDKEGGVRQGTNRFFKALFEKVPAGQITPFFPILSAHLRCAMTHIQDDIQLDSLQFMDLLLLHYPQLVTATDNKLLQCFIDQISKSGKESGSATRRLIVNPSSRLTSQKWRIRVLERLHNFMVAIAGCQNQEEKVKTPAQSWISGDANEHLPLSQYSSLWMCGVPGVARAKKRDKEHDENGQKEDVHSRTFIEMLFPLLCQCWIEVGPAQMGADTPGNALPADALATLSTIVRIILLIQQNMAKTSQQNVEWMRKKFMKRFMNYFMPHFPYDAHHQPVQGKKKGKSNEGPQVSCLSINLTVCEVMSHFIKKDEEEDHALSQQIGQFMIKVSQREKLSVDQLTSSLDIVTTLLKLPLKPAEENEMMGAVFKLYTRRRNKGNDKPVLLDFFWNCIKKKMVRLELSNVRKWIAILPQHLGEMNGHVNPVTLKLLEVMKVLACYNLPEFKESFQKYSLNILGIISPDMNKVHRGTIELLTNLPEFDRTHFAIITKLCQDGILSAADIRYLFQVIVYRSHSSNSPQVIAAEDFLSCVTSCLLGYSASDLIALQQMHKESHNSRFSIISAPSEKLQRQHQVSEVFASVLTQVPEEIVVWDAVTGALQNTLMTLKVLPEDLACSVLFTIVKLLAHEFELTEEFLLTLVDLTSSSLLHVFGNHGSISDSQETDVQINLLLSNQCEDFLRSSSLACEKLFLAVLRHLLRTIDLKEAHGHLNVLSKLLKDENIRKNLIQKKSEIETLLQAAQKIHKNITSLAGWSDIKYAVSLIK